MTNADKIRSMTDRELAEWLDEHDDQWDFCHNKCPYFDGMDCTKSAQSCKDGRLEWLKQDESYRQVSKASRNRVTR